MPINYEALLVESPERWEDYSLQEEDEETVDICAEKELNFED